MRCAQNAPLFAFMGNTLLHVPHYVRENHIYIGVLLVRSLWLNVKRFIWSGEIQLKLLYDNISMIKYSLYSWLFGRYACIYEIDTFT